MSKLLITKWGTPIGAGRAGAIIAVGLEVVGVPFALYGGWLAWLRACWFVAWFFDLPGPTPPVCPLAPPLPPLPPLVPVGVVVTEVLPLPVVVVPLPLPLGVVVVPEPELPEPPGEGDGLGDGRVGIGMQTGCVGSARESVVPEGQVGMGTVGVLGRLVLGRLTAPAKPPLRTVAMRIASASVNAALFLIPNVPVSPRPVSVSESAPQ